ncbi:MAG: adenosine deaminase [Clostridia bacterium]|nr:adenosine deaminase [Clostridia bacterium]
MEKYLFPKIELHLHLDGALRPETMWELAKEKKVVLPTKTLDEFREWIVKTSDCESVPQYLKRFELPLQLLQDRESLERVTYELICTLHAQGHIYDEIRFAPQLHMRQKMQQRDAVEAVLAGRNRALRELPDYGCGIILCAMSFGREDMNMEENLETVRLTKEYLGSGVVACDLAGCEGVVPVHNFYRIFDLARELDVPFTCHAEDPHSADSVRDVFGFGGRRIGHGHKLYDAPDLWQRARELGVTLEICPSSNIQCKTQPSFEEHPAKKLFDAGIRVTISTDNMTLAATSLDQEYDLCLSRMGFTQKDLVQMNIYAAEAAFMPEDQRKPIIEKLKAYL